MKKIRATAFAMLALAALTAPAHAAPSPKGTQQFLPLGTKLSSVALNAATALRTFTFQTKGYSKARFDITYTYATTGTLTLLCTNTSDASGTTDHVMTTCSTAAGACTLNFVTGATTPSLTASKNYSVVLGFEGSNWVECSLTHNNSPAAGDIATVTAELIAN